MGDERSSRCVRPEPIEIEHCRNLAPAAFGHCGLTAAGGRLVGPRHIGVESIGTQCIAQGSQAVIEDGEPRPLSSLFPVEQTSFDKDLEMVADRWLASIKERGKITSAGFAGLGNDVEQAQAYRVGDGLEEASELNGVVFGERRGRAWAAANFGEFGGFGEAHFSSVPHGDEKHIDVCRCVR